jgi:hypothetical protein
MVALSGTSRPAGPAREKRFSQPHSSGPIAHPAHLIRWRRSRSGRTRHVYPSCLAAPELGSFRRNDGDTFLLTRWLVVGRLAVRDRPITQCGLGLCRERSPGRPVPGGDGGNRDARNWLRFAGAPARCLGDPTQGAAATIGGRCELPTSVRPEWRGRSSRESRRRGGPITDSGAGQWLGCGPTPRSGDPATR